MQSNAMQSNAMPSYVTPSNAMPSNVTPSNVKQSNAMQSNATQSSRCTQNSCTTNGMPDHIKEVYAESAQNLNSDQKAAFKQLLIDFQDTFSRSSHDLGRTHLVEYQINLLARYQTHQTSTLSFTLSKTSGGGKRNKIDGRERLN